MNESSGTTNTKMHWIYPRYTFERPEKSKPYVIIAGEKVKYKIRASVYNQANRKEQITTESCFSELKRKCIVWKTSMRDVEKHNNIKKHENDRTETRTGTKYN